MIRDRRSILTGLVLVAAPPVALVTRASAAMPPVMSDGKMLAEKLEAAGVKTTYQNNDGVTHEFFGMDAVLDDAKRAQDFAVTDLKSAFAGTISN